MKDQKGDTHTSTPFVISVPYHKVRVQTLTMGLSHLETELATSSTEFANYPQMEREHIAKQSEQVRVFLLAYLSRDTNHIAFH